VLLCFALLCFALGAGRGGDGMADLEEGGLVWTEKHGKLLYMEDLIADTFIC